MQNQTYPQQLGQSNQPCIPQQPGQFNQSCIPQQGQYPQPYCGNESFQQQNNPGEEVTQERGLKKIVVAGAAAMAGHHLYKKHKAKKEKEIHVHGHGHHHEKKRQVLCDVLVDERGIELPGQVFDERGECINEQEVISRAVEAGMLPKYH